LYVFRRVKKDEVATRIDDEFGAMDDSLELNPLLDWGIGIVITPKQERWAIDTTGSLCLVFGDHFAINRLHGWIVEVLTTTSGVF
jgi:hypothetical protein